MPMHIYISIYIHVYNLNKALIIITKTNICEIAYFKLFNSSKIT